MTRRTLLDFIGTGFALLLAVVVLWAAERDPQSSPAGEVGTVVVRGRATLVDDREQEQRSLDGSFTLYVLRESGPGVLRRVAGPAGRRTVRVTGGRWQARVAADARLFVRELALGGTPTILEPVDDWAVFTLPETLRIDLVGRALYPRRLRVVDFETGRELEDVRVLDNARVREEPGARGPGFLLPDLEFDDGTLAPASEVDERYTQDLGIPHGPGELPGTWLRGASPIVVPPEDELSFRNLVVHVPGYALHVLDLEHLSSEEVEVRMTLAGTLRIHVAPCADVHRVLRVDRPDSEPPWWFLNVPLPAGRPAEEGSSEHDWFEWDRAARLRIEGGPEDGLKIELSPCAAVRWRARLLLGDGKRWYPQDEAEVLEELEFDVIAGETTEVDLAGCDH